MSSGNDIADHYSQGGLLERLDAALRADGVDPGHADLEALAPYDHFHGRGIEATRELAAGVSVSASDHLLDIGCGFGGPARFFASHFGCRVTGIDLTDEFCAVARVLTRRLGLEDRVTIEQGDALALPYADASFDGAYSMNVSMNIADKEALYRGIHRVLRPGGWLVLSEVAAGEGADAVCFPTPWARTAASSFLSTLEATRAGLSSSGFEVLAVEDRSAATLAFGERSRALVDAGGKPPHRAVQLVHGDLAATVAANSSRAVAAGQLIPVEVHCRKV